MTCNEMFILGVLCVPLGGMMLWAAWNIFSGMVTTVIDSTYIQNHQRSTRHLDDAAVVAWACAEKIKLKYDYDTNGWTPKLVIKESTKKNG
jgi:hypothetical protein